MTSTRPTLASTNNRIDEMKATLAEILAAIATPQHSTPTVIADAVEAASAAPKVEKASMLEQPKSAADQLKEFAESTGWKFAKGGRVELGLDEMKALTRVLKTGKPEIITVGKRTIAVGRTDDGTRAFTQNLYKPE